MRSTRPELGIGEEFAIRTHTHTESPFFWLIHVCRFLCFADIIIKSAKLWANFLSNLCHYPPIICLNCPSPSSRSSRERPPQSIYRTGAGQPKEWVLLLRSCSASAADKSIPSAPKWLSAFVKWLFIDGIRLALCVCRDLCR